MGTGIALVAALAGYPVILYEVNENVISRSKETVEKELQKMVEKAKLPEADKAGVQQLITHTTHINQCKANVVIEAIIEKEEAKVSIFNQLAAINDSHTIFASNTSSLSLTSIAQQLPQPQNFIGVHFFNPAHRMKLVEVITTPFTSGQTAEAILQLVKDFGKTAVSCKDAPGFIVNRVARPFYTEALRIAEEGKVSFKTIDKLMEAQGFRMGPFTLMDLIGNDINYAVSCSVYQQMQNPERLKPSPLQKEKVDNGHLGRKTGKGFYDY